MSLIQEKIDAFLAQSSQFMLGHLVTESSHHLTHELSEWAVKDLPQGLAALQAVDGLALRSLDREMTGIWQLHQKIQRVIHAGHDILLVGCGATGRLSLVLEVLALQMKIYPALQGRERVRAFMAGGDYALIKSVESFEDRTEYGARQLHEMGFRDGDLLLAITEGGETPFVIGACQEAARISHVAPSFLYCNPDATLEGLQRCWQVLNHPHIDKLNLTCGPMALTGSTRMQASTVQMAAAGLAMLYQWNSLDELRTYINSWREWQGQQDWSGLAPFIKQEAEWHKAGTPVTYVTSSDLAISLLTDTTERSPTFSQPAFENILEKGPVAPIYLAVRGTHSAPTAWQALLSRRPHPLEWPEFNGRIGQEVLNGFDISENSIQRRGGVQVEFRQQGVSVIWRNGQHTLVQPLWDAHPLIAHLSLKMAVNALSTLMMGRRGFYHDNVMTWVRPSNNKLIDRAVRYVRLLADRRGVTTDYTAVVHDVMNEMESGGDHSGGQGPVVIRVLKKLGIQLG